MFQKLMIATLIAVSSQFAFAVTCAVNEESQVDSNVFDKNISITSAELTEQGKILSVRGDTFVTAANSASGYSLSVFTYRPGMAKGEIHSMTVNKNLPIMLIDGKAKLSVYCY